MGTECCQWPVCPGSGDPSQRVSSRYRVSSREWQQAGAQWRVQRPEEGGAGRECQWHAWPANQDTSTQRQQPRWAAGRCRAWPGLSNHCTLRREKGEMKRAFYCYLHQRALCFSDSIEMQLWQALGWWGSINKDLCLQRRLLTAC